MSARDDYPILVAWARGMTLEGFNGDFAEVAVLLALDEIDRLRGELTAERTVRKQLAEAVVYDPSFDQTRVTELRAAALAASDALDKETTR